MAIPIPPSSLPPLTKEDLTVPTDAIVPSYTDEELQLQTDTINVLENRLPMSHFSSERQTEIINYWRFSATRQNSKSDNIAQRTFNTLDII